MKIIAISIVAMFLTGQVCANGLTAEDAVDESPSFYFEQGFTDIQPIHSILFGDDIGSLSWDKGYLEFKGDMEQSARIFFDDFIRGYVDAWIEVNCCQCEKK